MEITHPSPKKRGGTRAQRLLLYVAAGVLTCLLLWLWSFILYDVGAVTQPNWEEIQKTPPIRALEKQREDLEFQKNEVSRTISGLQENQKILRDSTNSTRETMNQLLENQKQLAAKSISLSPAEQESIAASQKLFLENQKRYQALNTDISSQTAVRRQLEQEILGVEHQLKPLQKQAADKYEKLYEKARIKAAIIKLCILVPLFLLALWFLLKKRNSAYGILVYSFSLSLLLKMADVVHEYFPSRYFKYVALLVLIGVVTALLVYLVRIIARPKPDLLLKQIREAYDRKECPTCAYPIQRGWLKEAGIAGKAKNRIIAIPTAVESGKQEPYSCPSCGERLFDDCPECHKVRHTLLPYCEHCGFQGIRAGSLIGNVQAAE